MHDLSLAPAEIIWLYALRFKIEVTFSAQGSSFELFLRQRLDLQRIEGTCLAA